MNEKKVKVEGEGEKRKWEPTYEDFFSWTMSNKMRNAPMFFMRDYCDQGEGGRLS